MSANNWGECPRCKQVALAAVDRLRDEANEAYGKVSREEWEELDRKAREADKLDLGYTLREDWEIGTDDDGEFMVDYYASCNECGFYFGHKHIANTLENSVQ